MRGGHPHVVVVGGGAAGLTAAAVARGAGAAVTLLERTPDGGRKILVSGGGRCNVLPAEPAPDRFVSDSPRGLVRSMLAAWPLRDQRRFFEEDLGLRLILEPDTGKLFPASGRARDVRDGLVALADARGVARRFGTPVVDVRPDAGGFVVQVGSGDHVRADRVVIATGGLSVPKTGSDGFGFDVARRLGHVVHPTYAALTPLIASPAIHASLSGISLDVTVEARSARERTRSAGGFLFTHRGYSGPAILDVSHVAVRSRMTGGDPATVRVRWSPLAEPEWTAALAPGPALVSTVVARHLPKRLAQVLVDEAGIAADLTCARLPREGRLRLVERLAGYALPWTGDEGFRTAEVTGGGVALDEVHRATLESRRVPGLYFCGEVLDAFGPIGGHNFQWAWSTGRSAGLAAGAP
ncbi:MAG: aminoacetone oxidase family FAD-binding enzyme [Vicinamibacterales bacterium]